MDITLETGSMGRLFTTQTVSDNMRPHVENAVRCGLSVSEVLHLLDTFEYLDEEVFIEYLKISVEMSKLKTGMS